MREQTELQKQQYKRFTQILDKGKKRYVEATGNHRGYRGGIKGQDYLTDEERQEAKLLLQQMFVISTKDSSVNSQGESQNLPVNSPLPKQQVEADS